MKKYNTALLLVLCLMISTPGWTQLDLLKKARQKTEKRTSEEADKKIDEGLDKLFGNKEKNEPAGTSEDNATIRPAGTDSEPTGTGESSAAATTAASPTGVLNWAKYDFVPGDKVIFEDNLIDEENGEFPSRWDLYQGTAEIAEVDGESVIFLRGGNPCIVPYLDNSSEDYRRMYLPLSLTFISVIIIWKSFFMTVRTRKRRRGPASIILMSLTMEWILAIFPVLIRIGMLNRKDGPMWPLPTQTGNSRRTWMIPG